MPTKLSSNVREALFDPYRILFNTKGAFGHYSGGEFDGPGGTCPNCRRRLSILVSLDLQDTRIRFPDKRLRRLPLLSCFDCELFHFDFAYRIKADGGLRICSALRSKGGDRNPSTSTIREARLDLDLTPAPPELERLAAKLNAGRELNSHEELLFGQLTKNFAPPEVDGYPVVNCYNQIGGQAS